MSIQYTYKVSKPIHNEWNKLLEDFKDTNIYQTIEFNNNSVGGKNLEQLVLYKNDSVVSIALIRIKILPLIRRGVAYVRWAPLWRKSESSLSSTTLREAIKAIHEEYVKKRKLVLRITSNLVEGDDGKYFKLFEEFKFSHYLPQSKSIRLDLTKDIDEIRSGLRKKWRYSLKQSEKQNQIVKMSNDPATFKIFKQIYSDMHNRKKFDEFVNVDVVERINEELLPKQRMQIFLCYENNTPLAGMIVTSMGDTGIYLLGGSTTRGLELGSAYLLQWEVINWLKKNGVECYDLGGIDQVSNPGVYTFKSGMGGNEITYLGAFEAHKDIISWLIVKLGEKIIKK